MAWQIEKIDVDGITFTGCRYTLATATDPEVAPEGVAEATIAAAATGSTITVTAVASPTVSPIVGVSREGIDYVAHGRSERCAVCGFVYYLRQMIKQRGGWVDRDCYDQRVPLRGRGVGALARRGYRHGAF